MPPFELNPRNIRIRYPDRDGMRYCLGHQRYLPDAAFYAYRPRPPRCILCTRKWTREHQSRTANSKRNGKPRLRAREYLNPKQTKREREYRAECERALAVMPRMIAIDPAGDVMIHLRCGGRLDYISSRLTAVDEIEYHLRCRSCLWSLYVNRWTPVVITDAVSAVKTEMENAG